MRKKILLGILGLSVILKLGFTQPAPIPVLDFAEFIGTVTTAFNNILSSADSDVQLALDTIDDIDASDIKVRVISGSTFETVQDDVDTYTSTGLIDGGAITDGGSETIDVAILKGALRDTNSHRADIYLFDLAAVSGTAIPTDTIRYIGVEYNAGSPQLIVKTTDSWNMHTEFPLGSVVNESGTIHAINNPQFVSNFAAHGLQRFYETEKLFRDNRSGGIIIGETGTRNVTVTTGTLWDRVNEFTIATIDTSGSDTFDSYSSAGLESSGNSQWDNANYDNSGTLTALGPNKYANLWWFIESDGDLVCVYGTAEYPTSAQASEEGSPSVLPDRIIVHGRIIGRYIFQEGAATTTTIESAFDTVFATTGITDHGNLGGLADNDHTQYGQLADNAVIAGDWDNTANPWDISDETNAAVSGTLQSLTGDTFSIKEGALTSLNICQYDATGTLLKCSLPPTDDTLLMGSGSDWQNKTIPNCTGSTQHLRYTQATNTWSCTTESVPITYWEQTGTVIHPGSAGSITDEVSIGATATVNSSKFSIDGDDDQIQMVIQGNATQNSDLLLLEKSDGSDLIRINEDGHIGLDGTAPPTTSIMSVDSSGGLRGALNFVYEYTSGTAASNILSSETLSVDFAVNYGILNRQTLNNDSAGTNNFYVNAAEFGIDTDISISGGVQNFYGYHVNDNRGLANAGSSGGTVNKYGVFIEAFGAMAGSITTRQFGIFTNEPIVIIPDVGLYFEGVVGSALGDTFLSYDSGSGTLGLTTDGTKILTLDTDGLRTPGMVSRFGFYYAYASAEIAGNVAYTTLDLDTVVIADSDYYSESAGTVTIQKDGLYKIGYHVNFDLDAGTRYHGRAAIFVNVGVGDTLIGHSESGAYARITTQAGTSATNEIIHSLNANDTVELKAIVENTDLDIGGVITEPANLVMEYIRDDS